MPQSGTREGLGPHRGFRRQEGVIGDGHRDRPGLASGWKVRMFCVSPSRTVTVRACNKHDSRISVFAITEHLRSSTVATNQSLPVAPGARALIQFRQFRVRTIGGILCRLHCSHLGLRPLGLEGNVNLPR
jgi:hypothetical protein